MNAPVGRGRTERWQMRQRLASFPTLETTVRPTAVREARHSCDEALSLPALARMEHSRKHEADPAERPRRVALQCFLDPVIFLEHFRSDRGAGLDQRDLEILHRHFARVEPATKRREAGSSNEVLKVGASEALRSLGKAFEI